MTYKEFASKHGIAYQTVKQRASSEKWLNERKQARANNLEITGGKHVIKHMAQLLLQAKEAFMTLQDEDDYFYSTDGKVSLNKIDRFLSTYKELERLIRSSFDVLPAQAQKQIELDISKFELRKKELGEYEEETASDNFILALKETATAVWKE